MRTYDRLGKVFAVFAVFVACVLPAQAGQLPSDPKIVQGELANGVKWLYRQHDNPPGKMALMIHVDTGSLNETEEQRGLAHFLEHMAFNGTEHFGPGELIKYFEGIGMEFGADLNAFTSFDQTVYMLFTPDTKPAQLDKALTVLSDYAFRMLLLEEEIEKERGVILEESRSGKNAFQRIRDKLWPELFAGSRFAERLPIGLEEVIINAPKAVFEDYYRAWYRPENVTVLLVGDARSDEIIPFVEKWFGEYRSPVPAREPLGAEFTPFTEQRAMVVTDPEMAFCEVGMMNIYPGRPPTTTVSAWRTELVEYIGTWLVDRRYENRVNEGLASFRGASSSVSDFFDEALLVSANAEGEPQDWAKMIEELVVEVSRARSFGFTDRELQLAKKEILAEAERAVRTEPTRAARGFLFGMLSAVNNKEPILSAQQELDLLEELLPSIQIAEVSETFKKHFRPGTFAYTVEMVEKDGVPVPTREDVLACAGAAWARRVEPIKEDAAPTELLASMPTPGKVVERVVDADLDVTCAWLDNGVRVHHRFMDYKKDTVFVSVALAGGEIEETAANSKITDVASLAINEAATNRLTSTNIRDIMTGKNIRIGARGEGDSLTIQMTGSPIDLEAGLQEAHALLTDGKIEESAFKNWKLGMLQQIEMMQTMPMFKAYEAMMSLLTGDDPRLKPITKEDVERQSIAAAQAWFDRLCREAPIEVAVVGDISVDAAMSLIEKYIGSLPKRSRTADHLSKLRRLARPTGPLARHVEVETMTPQGMAFAGFVGCNGRDAADRRALDLAANVLDSRLIKTIREDLGLVYSIGARNNASWVFEDAGQFGAGAPCDPANAEAVAEKVHEMFQAFADDGPTEEELQNAKKQIANNLDTEMKEPNYWWRVLRHIDLHGGNLNDEKVEKEAFSQFTTTQVRDVFRKYYKPARQFRVTAVPTKADVAVEEEAGEAATAGS